MAWLLGSGAGAGSTAATNVGASTMAGSEMSKMAASNAATSAAASQAAKPSMWSQMGSSAKESVMKPTFGTGQQQIGGGNVENGADVPPMQFNQPQLQRPQQGIDIDTLLAMLMQQR